MRQAGGLVLGVVWLGRVRVEQWSVGLAGRGHAGRASCLGGGGWLILTLNRLSSGGGAWIVCLARIGSLGARAKAGWASAAG